MGIAAKGMELGNKLTSKVAYKAGGGMTDVLSRAGLSPEAAALGGAATNFGIEAIPAFAGGPAAKKATAEQGMALGRRWMQQALQPSKAARDSGKAEQGIETMLKEGVNVSKGGVEKLNKSIDALQDEMTRALKDNPYVIEPHKVVKELDAVFDKYRKQATYKADQKTIQNALNEFINHPLIKEHGGIPIETANAIKSGTYRQIGDKGYGMGLKPDAERDALKGIARGLQKEIAGTPGVPSGIGKRQQELINARDLAEQRVGSAGNRMEAGLAYLISHPWVIPGYIWDRSPMLKSMAARSAYRGTPAGVAGSAVGTTAGAASGMAPRQAPPPPPPAPPQDDLQTGKSQRDRRNSFVRG